jgi:hypothetical protein
MAFETDKGGRTMVARGSGAGTRVFRTKQQRYSCLHDPRAPINDESLYGVGDACARSGLSPGPIYQAFSGDPERRGALPHLPSVKVGRSRRIRGSALRAWLDALARGEAVDGVTWT